jgi:hypothetical protein
MKSAIGLAAAILAAPAGAQTMAPATPLFASDAPVRLTIRAPMSTLVSDRSGNPHNGTLSVTGTAETHPVALSARGITRRQGEICPFPPLRVQFPARVAAGLFARQGRLKLVTHCQQSAGFQQKVLLEYAAYRLYNALTPHSFRVRLATIDYVDDSGRPHATRVGFFIEDVDDLAHRNGLVEATSGERVPLARIEPAAGARFAMFNYLIGNLDWSMRAGPPGNNCCHNGRLIAASKDPGAVATPVPYDFDFSGLVDAPYATPPEGFNMRSVRQRLYRGYCAHSAQAPAVASEIAAKRGELLGLLGTIPGLDERSRARAAAYLEAGFNDIATGKPLAKCVG